MKLDDLITQRRMLLDKDSLLRPTGSCCLTLEKIENLALRERGANRKLCNRCRSLLELFREHLGASPTRSVGIKS